MGDFKLPRLSIQTVLYTEGEFSLSKAALLLSMVDNEFDAVLVEFLTKLKCFPVITRAGGRGENFKDKILRNAIAAASKTNILPVSRKSQQLVKRAVEDIILQMNLPLLGISGGGVKIGMVRRESSFAMAVFGTIGIPGLEIDREVGGVAHFPDVL
jgi:hypothetical protein